MRTAVCALLLTLLGCESSAGSGSPGHDSSPAPPAHDAPGEQLGGNSGTEGTPLPCVERELALTSHSAPFEPLGVSTQGLLDLTARRRELPMRWDARDSGPAIKTGVDTLTLELEPRGMATGYQCDDPTYPDKHRPAPRIELPVLLSLRTSDGVLDERLEATLVASEATRASINLTVPIDQLKSSAGRAIAQFYSGGTRDLMLELRFDEHGARGWIGGPFSPHRARPCAYTPYATWPADALCWPEERAQPVDHARLQRDLGRANRSFELQWSDGTRSDGSLHVALADGPACLNASGALLRHRVSIRLQSADGRVDLTLPGTLTGGASTVEPWPSALRDVEPFHLDLAATVALTADDLRKAFGSLESAPSAAIVSLYLSTPSSVSSPLLGGGLRVVAIDRAGFATPLPLVELPGGDSERCFDASGSHRAPIVHAELALKR
jgi:hypothetical protein